MTISSNPNPNPFSTSAVPQITTPAQTSTSGVVTEGGSLLQQPGTPDTFVSNAGTTPVAPTPAPTPTTGNTGLTQAEQEALQPLITASVTSIESEAAGTTYTQQSATSVAQSAVNLIPISTILNKLGLTNKSQVYSIYQAIVAASKPGAKPLTQAQLNAFIKICEDGIANNTTAAGKLPFQQMLAQLNTLQTNLNNNVAGATATAAEAMSHLGCILQTQAIINAVQKYLVIKMTQALLNSNSTPTTTTSK